MQCIQNSIITGVTWHTILLIYQICGVVANNTLLVLEMTKRCCCAVQIKANVINV